MNKAHLINLLQKCYLIACALVISDKVLAFSGGIFNGIVFRPRLIGEINFDIILIIQLWLLLKLYMPGYKKIYGYLLFFVVIISLSRSGIIGYALTYYFYMQTRNNKFNLGSFLKNILLVVAGLGLILLIYYIRDPNLDFKNIDRIQLLTALVNSYDNDSLFNLFFGHGLFAPLPNSICEAFSYYALSTTGDETNCNPVILFSYFLRCTFEYGLLITFLIPFFYFKLLQKNISAIRALSLLMPAIAVSLAVGGFYNSLAILSLVIAKYTSVAFEPAQSPAIESEITPNLAV